MKQLFLAAIMLIALKGATQDRTGVWRGVVIFGQNGYSFNQAFLPSINNTLRSGKVLNESTRSGRQYINGNPEFETKAKLEIVQLDERMLAQLTSYSEDNSLITMYEFYVRPTPKEFYKYHLQAKSVLVNETIRKADLFDLRGSFKQTDSGYIFYGIWEDPFGRRRYGTFYFSASEEFLGINPELWHKFLKKNAQTDESKLSPALHYTPSPILDTLVTEEIAVYGNLVENGLTDQDTLSIWLNGRLIEDDIVPGKKPYHFRINLGQEEWNHITIRCKSEGKEKGAGVHLNLKFGEQQLKYNLALYQYQQSDWVIRRKIR